MAVRRIVTVVSVDDRRRTIIDPAGISAVIRINAVSAVAVVAGISSNLYGDAGAAVSIAGITPIAAVVSNSADVRPDVVAAVNSPVPMTCLEGSRVGECGRQTDDSGKGQSKQDSFEHLSLLQNERSSRVLRETTVVGSVVWRFLIVTSYSNRLLPSAYAGVLVQPSGCLFQQTG
jgi:hypothetical protein